MISLSPIRFLILFYLSAVVSANWASAQPLITTVNPAVGVSGTGIDIFGTGFTGVSRVLFIDRNTGSQVDATFSGLSDIHVSTTVPTGVGSQWLVSLFTPLGGTVVIPEDFFNITSPISGGPGSLVYVVQNGGAITNGVGSSLVFIESGGSYDSAGAGSDTIFVKQGGSYIQGGGGGSLIFYEPGASLNTGGGGIFTQVPDLQPSFVTIRPVITAPMMLPNGQFQFSFNTKTGVDYEVECSTNLTQWLPLVTLGGIGVPLTVIDPNTAGSQQRFYRIILSPQ